MHVEVLPLCRAHTHTLGWQPAGSLLLKVEAAVMLFIWLFPCGVTVSLVRCFEAVRRPGQSLKALGS